MIWGQNSRTITALITILIRGLSLGLMWLDFIWTLTHLWGACLFKVQGGGFCISSFSLLGPGPLGSMRTELSPWVPRNVMRFRAYDPFCSHCLLWQNWREKKFILDIQWVVLARNRRAKRSSNGNYLVSRGHYSLPHKLAWRGVQRHRL